MSLKSDLESVFNDMKDITDSSGNSFFAENVADCLSSYYDSITLQTSNVSGTVSAGVFAAGAGSGNPDSSAVKSACNASLLAACTAMDNLTEGGNAYLATQMGTAIHTMCLGAKIEFTVAGTVTTPSGVASALSGKVTCTPVGVNTTLISDLKNTFEDMNDITEDGESSMASGMSDAMENYISSLTFPLVGTEALAGAVGTASVT